jgi:hypothetical protein
MNSLIIRKFCIILFFLVLTFTQANAQIFHKNPEKKLFGKTIGNKKKEKVSEPRLVSRARKKQEATKKKQEAAKKKLDKEYEKSIKKSRKRTFDIQTTEVQERMKQDQKNIADRDKGKKKKSKRSTKKAGKKYK